MQLLTDPFASAGTVGQALEYNFNNSVVEPPLMGELRCNQATQAATTKLWVSHTTVLGVNIKQFISSAAAGAQLVLQDKIDNSNFAKFAVVGPALNKTTYWEFPVANTGAAGNLPRNRVLVSVTGPTTSSVPQEARLTYVSATALSFAPFKGNHIKINGSIYVIPAAGIVGLANTNVFVNGATGQNLAANTTYYVYAFVNAGTVTADFRTDGNGHMTDTTLGNEGVEVRCLSGTIADSTRTLIGIIRTNASSQFVDGLKQRFVRSWTNRVSRNVRNVFSADRSTASLTFVELNAEIRCEFVLWSGEIADMTAIVACYPGIVIKTDGWMAAIGFDGITAEPGQAVGQASDKNSEAGGSAPRALRSDLSEGYHYATFLGAAYGSGSSAATFLAARCAMQGLILL